jgi:hypothetical protein
MKKVSLDKYLKGLGYTVTSTNKGFSITTKKGTLDQLTTDLLKWKRQNSDSSSEESSTESSEESSPPPPKKTVVPPPKKTVPQSSEESDESSPIKPPPKKTVPPKKVVPQSSSSSTEESSTEESSEESSPIKPPLKKTVPPKKVVPESSSSSTEEQSPTESQCFKLCSPFTFTKKNINEDRKVLLDTIVKKYGAYPKITEQMMRTMYEYYDEHFFYGLLSKQVKQSKGIDFVVSNKSTSAAGSARASSPVRLMLSEPIFEGVTPANIAYVSVNGVKPVNRVDAILRVMEHELTHVALHTSDTDEHALEHHGALFKSIVLNLFGHTETTHQLKVSSTPVLSLKSGAPQSYNTVMLNSIMSFRNSDGTIITGLVTAVKPKKATITTKDRKSYGVPYRLLIVPDKDTLKLAKDIKSVVMVKSDFSVGDNVSYKDSRTGIISKGKIVKMNPVKAVVRTSTNEMWSIGYSSLIKG